MELVPSNITIIIESVGVLFSCFAQNRVTAYNIKTFNYSSTVGRRKLIRDHLPVHRAILLACISVTYIN